MIPTCSCGKFPDTYAEIHPRVLVIDDEPLVRWSLVEGLRHAGLDATGAAAPEQASHSISGGADLVLLDVQLWGRDPRLLLEQVRRLSPRARILLLVVEGYDVSLPDWKDADVIRKPFDLHDVIERVWRALPEAPHDVRMAG